VSDLARWLDAVNLGHLRAIFEDNDVDLDRLQGLAEQDLERLGLTPSERRRLKVSLAELTREGPRRALEPRAEPARYARDHPPVAPAVRTAERRQLTVLFCDLVGSSALSTKLDPEDFNLLVGLYRDACAKPIERHGGFISRFVGDGILACFGYPHAHEDDAERAIWAGLGVVAAVKTLQPHAGRFVDRDHLAVRIGIGTGLVVVGDIVGHGHLERNAIVGEAPNLAARLQGLAEPNGVVIDKATRDLAGGIFEYRALGQTALKGFAQPQLAWEVTGESGLENRFEAMRMRDARLVGREAELDLLFRLWDRARAGQGQVALLTGEAGIGKSHLAAAFRDRIVQRRQAPAKGAPVAIGFHGSPRHSNTALYPMTRRIERLAGFDRDDSHAVRWRKLVQLVTRSGWSEEGEELPLLADLLGIERNAARPLARMSPREWRARTLRVLERWLEWIAAERPLLLVFEDIQWMDASTWQLFQNLVGWSASAKVLLLATWRTGDTSPAARDLAELEKSAWRQAANVTGKELAPLAQGEARHLIAVTARDQALPGEVVEGILARADGIPLYLEELTRSLSAEADHAQQGSEARQGTLTARAVPSSLNNALAARLDRVGPAREIAQIASVIGREFPARLLSVVCPLPKEHLQSGLERLLEAGLIKSAGGGDPSYVFRHALIQNAAYRTLLKQRRREIHLALARHLESAKAAHLEVADEALAEHFERGGAPRQAIAIRERAAKTALERGAQVEAARLLEAAITTLAELPDDRERRQLELELTMELATALGAIRSFAPEVEKQYLRARDLCVELDRTDLRFSVEFGLTICKFVKGDLQAADGYGAGLLAHAQQHPDKPLVDAYLAKGMIRTQQGRFEEARELFMEGAELSRPELDQPHFFTHGLNPGIYCNSYLANVLAYMGRAREAVELMERTLDVARRRASEPSHAYSYVSALAIAGRVYLILRDGAAVRQRSKDLIDVARRHHYLYFENIGKIQQCWALTTQGPPDAIRLGAERMRDALATLVRTGVGLGLRGFYAQLADIYARLGDKAEALATLNRAVDRPGYGPRSWDAEIQRVLGEVLRLAPDPDPQKALACFTSAIAIAQQQGARAFELRAAKSCAEMLLQMHRPREAQDLLTPYLRLAEPGTIDEVEISTLMVQIARNPVRHAY
jgi:class 3 adenylate cyclase/tetratricopeptide (TPR) repeat protein